MYFLVIIFVRYCWSDIMKYDINFYTHFIIILMYILKISSKIDYVLN